MVLRTLFYVSESSLQIPSERERFNDIVEVARSRNPILNVTGALLFTETHFAQVLEGPAASLEMLMKSILADDRHQRVDVVFHRPSKARRFASWSLAFTGQSAFVKRRIKAIVGSSQEKSSDDRQVAAHSLIRLMKEFVGDALAPVSS
jgi:hypothetical protein